jgi:1-aminocyclopropane-1-carboxylate deaminase
LISYHPSVNSLNFNGRKLDVLRLDLIHPGYGGNKIFKLEYNIQKAIAGKAAGILTFGGAHSNHIYSAAAKCSEIGIPSAGVIRGKENEAHLSDTLRFAKSNGMSLNFVSRSDYRTKSGEFMNELRTKFPGYYIIPEGGNNMEGVNGCMEILTPELKKYDYVFCACGTAATYSGIKASAGDDQKIIGISVLKGEDTLTGQVNDWLFAFGKQPIKKYDGAELNSSVILSNYHLGGYGAFSEELVRFKKQFERDHGITLDYLYTAKLFYAVFDLLNLNRIDKDASVLVVHSGGLQGNPAFEERYHLNAMR